MVTHGLVTGGFIIILKNSSAPSVAEFEPVQIHLRSISWQNSVLLTHLKRCTEVKGIISAKVVQIVSHFYGCTKPTTARTRLRWSARPELPLI